MKRLVFYAFITWAAMQAVLPALDHLGNRATTIEETIDAAVRGE